MKAVIMAGGSGTRLRPLTCNLPKPLATVCGRPAAELILDLLGRHGIDEAVFTLMYKGQKIEGHFSDDAYHGIKLDFSYETKPLGTAGCVRQAMEGIDEPFVVISGDAVCDFDLTKAIKLHKKRKADATIIVKKVDDPREYGLVSFDDEGRVLGFSEKPSYSGCVVDTANTGVYILSPSVLQLIPTGEQSDFAQNIFPLMLERDMELFAVQEEGYWCDIGDFQSYIRCQRDVLEGKVSCEIEGTRFNNGSILQSLLPVSVIADGPVFVGKNVRVGEGTRLLKGTVVGDNTVIGSGCKLNGCVVHEGVHISDGVKINSAVVCSDVKIKENACVYEGCVLGEGCKIGENAVISAGVRIWNNKDIPAGATITYDVKYGSRGRIEFGDDGFFGATNIEITPQIAALCGLAAGTISGGRVALGGGGERASAALKAALISGISASGADVCDFGDVPVSMLIHSSKFCSANLIVHISSGINTKINIFDEGGLPLTRVRERQIEACINRGEYSKAGWLEFGQLYAIRSSEIFYSSMLEKLADFRTNYNLTITCTNRRLSRIFTPIAEKISDSGGLHVEITIFPDGQGAEFFSEATGTITHDQLLMLACMDCFKAGFDAAVPSYFPSFAGEIAQQYGKKLYRFYSSSSGNDQKARKLARGEPFLFDGAVLALVVLGFLERNNLSLSAATKLIPSFKTERRFVRLACPTPKIMKRLRQFSTEESDGVMIKTDGGKVFMRPDKLGNGLYVFAESFSSETASGLCDEAEQLISKLSLDN